MLQWPWNKKKVTKSKASNDEMEDARKLIDAVIYPQIKKQIEILNKHLEKKNLQVGVDITWIFEKLE